MLIFTSCPKGSIAELKQQNPKKLGEENNEVRIPHYSPPLKEAREETERVRQLEVGANVAPWKSII